MSNATGTLPDPQTLEHLPGEGDDRAAPVVFVHGAFATPWVWRRNFMPWFAARGHDAFAVRLRGAGAVPGTFLEPGLEDYLDDLEVAIQSIGRPPIVVAHSLGALVAQMGLGRIPMQGLVLLAPAPAAGMFWSSMRLAVQAPDLWARTVMSTADSGFATSNATRDALFTANTDAAIVDETHDNLRSQPSRPLMEAQWPRHVPSAERLQVPVLTVAAEHDRLIPPDVVERTARYHGGTHLTLNGSGHAMMLDEQWVEAANGIARWLAAEPD